MKRKIIVGVSVLTVLALSAGFFLYNKPAEKRVTGRADYSLTANELFSEYSKDETAADDKYLNKVLSVTGTVSEVSSVDSLGITILLNTDSPLFGVSCQFPSGKNGTLPKLGDAVEIKGLCSGKLMDVVLVRCVVEN